MHKKNDWVVYRVWKSKFVGNQNKYPMMKSYYNIWVVAIKIGTNSWWIVELRDDVLKKVE